MRQRTLQEGMKELGATSFHQGKVGDVFEFPNDLVAVVRSNRLSAFNYKLPREILHKGHILNAISWEMLKNTRHVCPNWATHILDPQMTIGHKCEPILVEMVVRGYLAGHAWREYRDGKRAICGMTMPDGMKENDPFREPIITPTAKSEDDEDLTFEEILARGLCTEQELNQMALYALDLFREGTKIAYSRGLILVDTKYEFGRLGANGPVMLIDEVHTPDSSRYWYADGYQGRQERGEPQKQLSKEFVREWLIQQGFQGRLGDLMPEMSDAKVKEISDRYIELYEVIMARKFIPVPVPATISSEVRIVAAMHGHLHSERA